MRRTLLAAVLTILSCSHNSTGPGNGGDGGVCANGSCLGKSCTGDADCGAYSCFQSVCIDPFASADGGTDDSGLNFTDAQCARIDANVSNKIPIITLLLDRSQSMLQDFNGLTSGTMYSPPTKWDALKTALNTDLLPAYTTKVRFGSALFSSVGGNHPCPTPLTEVNHALDNASTISASLAANDPNGGTATPSALRQAGQQLHDLAEFGPNDGERIIVLATDGLAKDCALTSPPNGYTSGDYQAGMTDTELAVQQVYALGIKTRLLFVGHVVGTPASDGSMWNGPVTAQTQATHLQHLANYGAGVTSGATYYTATNASELQTAFDDLVKGTRSCTFQVSGTIQSTDGADIRLNGSPLALSDTNGWHVAGANIELTGAACTTYLANSSATLTASFACGTFVP